MNMKIIRVKDYDELSLEGTKSSVNSLKIIPKRP